MQRVGWGSEEVPVTVAKLSAPYSGTSPEKTQSGVTGGGATELGGKPRPSERMIEGTLHNSQHHMATFIRQPYSGHPEPPYLQV